VIVIEADSDVVGKNISKDCHPGVQFGEYAAAMWWRNFSDPHGNGGQKGHRTESVS
jgi:hypothetical protein